MRMGKISEALSDPKRNESFRRRMDLKVNKHAGEDACWEWQGYRDCDGYGRINYGRKFLFPTHRLAFALANGDFDESLYVCHRCDNPSCCNPSHLFLGTNQDNLADMVAKGRNKPIPTRKGEECHQSKLNDGWVIALRNGEISSTTLAAMLGVNRATCNQAKWRKTWKHLP